jgi:hypothetical protein
VQVYLFRPDLFGHVCRVCYPSTGILGKTACSLPPSAAAGCALARCAGHKLRVGAETTDDKHKASALRMTMNPGTKKKELRIVYLLQKEFIKLDDEFSGASFHICDRA